MFDFLRDLTKPDEEKRQELLTAYIDEALSPRERRRFEQMLAEDPGLRAELAQLRQLQQNLRQLPRRRVPRNFTLDPALYETPQRQPLVQLYPAMRVATTLTAVFLIIAVAANLLIPTGARDAASSAPVAMQPQIAAETAMDTAEEAEEAAFEADMAEEASVETAVSGTIVQETSATAAATSPPVTMEVAEAEELVAELAVTAAEEMAEEPPPVELDEAVKATPLTIAPAAPETETLAGEPMQTDGSDDIAAGNAATSSEAPPAPVAATPSPTTTTTPDTPRIQPTEAINRAVVTEEPAATAVAAVPEPGEDVTPAAETSVTPLTQPRSTIYALRVIQIGLAVLLVLLGTAVWYTRRLL